MGKNSISGIVLLLALMLGSYAQAEVVVDFSLSEYTVVTEGGAPSGDIGGPFSDTDVIASEIASANVRGYGFVTGGSGCYSGELNYASWDQAVVNDRLAIEITVQDGMYLDLSSLTLNIVRNGAAAPENLNVSLAFDDIAVSSISEIEIRSGSLGAMPAAGFEKTFDLSSIHNQIGTFTLWVKTPDAKSGNFRINNIVVEGTFGQVKGTALDRTLVAYEKGENGTFEVTLIGDTDPTTPVTVTVDPNSPGYVETYMDVTLTSATTPNNIPGEALALSFTQVNVPQTVTVTAVADSPLKEDIETTCITFKLTGNSAFAGGFIAPVFVTVVDADSASVITDGLVDMDLYEGDPIGGEFTLKLGSVPTDDVTIVFYNLAEPNEVNIIPSIVTFTAADYNVAQTVKVVSIDNDIVKTGSLENHATELTTISFDMRTNDLAYAALLNSFVLRIYDDECGAWGFSEADFNFDCKVDILDYAAFAGQWMISTQPTNP